MQLKDKISVVTGGASGIGRQIALTLAKEGSKVVILDIKEEDGKKVEAELNELSEGKFLNCDLRSVKNIEDTISRIEKTYGTIDVLVNCAGLANRTPIVDITEQEWDLLNDVNLKAAFFVSKEVAKIMIKNGGGKIINISSQRAHTADGKHTIYDVTKAGLEAMTRSFAVAFAKDNINVNAVAPGYVLTPMTAHNLERKGWREWICSRIPKGRLIEMQEVADAVLFFASDKCSGVTGQTLLVDGGWVIHN